MCSSDLDAGEAASGVVNHLGIAWQATPIGAIDPEDFYDFQVNRPVVEIEGGQTQRLIWPTTRISVARAEPASLVTPDGSTISRQKTPITPAASSDRISRRTIRARTRSLRKETTELPSGDDRGRS